MNATNQVIGEQLYLSKKGMKELKKEIGRLTRDQKQILIDLKDLDKVDSQEERFARVEKLAQLESTESALTDKQAYLASAKLFPRKRDALKVAIGSMVELIDTNGRMVRYTLVDSFEANPLDGRISVKSPLGAELVGKQIKDVVQWTAGLGKRELQLVRIM